MEREKKVLKKLHLSVPFLVHIFLVRELNCIEHEMACKG